MLVLLILSVILGAVVSGLTGIGFLFWVVAIIVFILGLPGALIGGVISNIQDRADARETERQLNEDLRMDRYLDKLDEIEDKRESRYFD